jgi:putative sigma-54 modulation protein
MEVLVRNAEGNVPLPDREYAARKLGRLDRFFHNAQKVEMVHREDKQGGHRVEITLFADGFTLRGEETDGQMRAAIDKVCDKLEARLRKLKGRIVDYHRKRGHAAPPKLADEVEHDPQDDDIIAERKAFALKPMNEEEAILQMEMVGHDFFLFRDEGSRQVGLLYRRKDGRLGLIHSG